MIFFDRCLIQSVKTVKDSNPSWQKAKLKNKIEKNVLKSLKNDIKQVIFN